MHNYRYHVITSFSRFENLVVFSRMLKEFGVMWHPIIDDDLPFRLAASDWIDPCAAPRAPAGFNKGNWYVNWFLDHHPLFDRSRYIIMPDDNFFEPGFFDKVDKHDGELLICSMLRGHNGTASGYPTNTLMAAPENLFVGGVGGEQLIISGRLLRELRYGPNMGSDGQVIMELAKGNKVEFVPDAYVWFNYLEPGRWNK